jgi:hypothetical protein
VARLKFRFLNPLHVWKIARFGFQTLRTLHNPQGIAAKSLMNHALLDRTLIGAIRTGTARFRDFSPVSAGFLTGFSADSSEN